MTVVTLEGGVKVDVTDPTDHIQAFLAAGNYYESRALGHMRRHLHRRRGVVVDAGAYIGSHTLFLAGVCGRRVHAFEPNPAAAEILRANLALNPGLDVVVHDVALGAWSGRGRLSVVDPTNLGTTSVRPVDVGGKVHIAPLDRVVSERVALLKIDVEGMELAVLHGAQQVIARHRPLVYVEVIDPSRLPTVQALLPGYERVRKFGATPLYVFFPRKV